MMYSVKPLEISCVGKCKKSKKLRYLLLAFKSEFSGNAMVEWQALVQKDDGASPTCAPNFFL